MMKKYDKYKNSGVEWIGEIPEHWKLKRTKWLYSESKSRNRELEFIAEDLLSVSEYYGVAKRTEKIDNNALLNRAESLEEYKIVSPGELVINIMLAWKKGLGVSDYNGIVSPSYCVFVLIDKNNNPRFFHYLYLTNLYSEIFRQNSRGIIDSRLRLYPEEFFNTLTILPSSDEQTAIARYLEKKTAQIDQIIAMKQRLIELFKEERTALINQAMTKGLDQSVEMKDSGVEWVGNIPAHWQIKRLKYLVKGKLEYGANEVAEMNDCDLPRYIRITDFDESGNLKEDTFKSLPHEIAKDYMLTDGDILFARSGATVGKTFQFRNYKGKACFAGYLIKASPNENEVISDFLYYFTKSNAYENWKSAIFNQATIQNIGADKYQILVVPLTAVKEQEEIVSYLTLKTEQIDAQIEIENKSIEYLREYRTALISEVVTGKIKVI